MKKLLPISIAFFYAAIAYMGFSVNNYNTNYNGWIGRSLDFYFFVIGVMKIGSILHVPIYFVNVILFLLLTTFLSIMGYIFLVEKQIRYKVLTVLLMVSFFAIILKSFYSGVLNY